jgi:ADP-ribosylglycohydrolase
MTDIIKGMIYGGAIGDAYGLMTEFMTKDEVIKNYGSIQKLSFDDFIQDGHRICWKKGDWTDDTDQAILIDKAVKDNIFDMKMYSKLLINWIDKGLEMCGDTRGVGVGNTANLFWGDYYAIDNPFLAGICIFTYNPFGPFNNNSNGSLMRCYRLVQYGDLNNIINNTIKSSFTHPSPYCVGSCILLNIMIYYVKYYKENNIKITNKLINNIVFDSFNIMKRKLSTYVQTLNKTIKELPNLTSQHPMHKIIQNNVNEFSLFNFNKVIERFIKFINVSEFTELKLDEEIGYVLKTIACAVIAFKKSLDYSFEDILIQIISEGGDSDTNCAVSGALIGSVIGYNNINSKLHTNLIYKNIL